MGERKGTNKYYPPDFDPQRHRNLAGYTGQHPLRERARKLKQGILIIRFEMPYNIWCDGCKNHIGMGVRYNAEKSKVGMYYTTPIYKFRMKCHLCDNYIEMKTDPANCEYVIISGARRKEQRWDPKDNEQIVTDDKADIKKMATDAMFKLEHGINDKQKVQAAAPTIAELTRSQRERKDDYMLNSQARAAFREEKQKLHLDAESDAELLKKASLDIKLVKEHQDDVRMAQLIKYSTVTSLKEKEKMKRHNLDNQSIFSIQDESASDTPSSSSSDGSQSSKDKKLNMINLQRKLHLNPTQPSPFSKGLQQRTTVSGGSKALSAKSLGIVHKPVNRSETETLSSRDDKGMSAKSSGKIERNSTDKPDFENLLETNRCPDSSPAGGSDKPVTGCLNAQEPSVDISLQVTSPCIGHGTKETVVNNKVASSKQTSLEADSASVINDRRPSSSCNGLSSLMGSYMSGASSSEEESD